MNAPAMARAIAGGYRRGVATTKRNSMKPKASATAPDDGASAIVDQLVRGAARAAKRRKAPAYAYPSTVVDPESARRDSQGLALRRQLVAELVGQLANATNNWDVLVKVRPGDRAARDIAKGLRELLREVRRTAHGTFALVPKGKTARMHRASVVADVARDASEAVKALSEQITQSGSMGDAMRVVLAITLYPGPCNVLRAECKKLPAPHVVRSAHSGRLSPPVSTLETEEHAAQVLAEWNAHAKSGKRAKVSAKHDSAPAWKREKATRAVLARIALIALGMPEKRAHNLATRKAPKPKPRSK